MKNRVIHIKYQKIELVSLTSFMEENINVPDSEFEPSNVIARKVALIQEALDCSEEEAERIVLNR